MNTRPLFCANCQATTDHALAVNPVNPAEVILTCTAEGCDRFHKVPSAITADEFKAFQQGVEENNKGQVSLEKVEQSLQF